MVGMQHAHLACAVILVLGACSSAAAPGATAGDTTVEDDCPDGAEGEDAPGPAGSAVRAIYSAEAGVSTPWWSAVGAGGVAESIRLAPERAVGYGELQGDIAYPDVTPDGAWIVVIFYPHAGGAALYGLPVDGSGAAAPVEIARVPEPSGMSSLSRAYDATRVAWVASGSLYVAPLDGSGEATLVAAPDLDCQIEDPHWAGQRLVFDCSSPSLGYYSWVGSALADGSEAGAPVWLTDPTDQFPKEHAGGVLGDGRVLMAGANSRLQVVPAGGGERLTLTPEDKLASWVGASPDGSRVVAELRVTWEQPRELISVATDGSGATVYLTPAPTTDLDAIVSRGGDRVAWVGRGDGQQWAVFEGSLEEVSTQVTGWSGAELEVTDFAHGVLVGARGDGAVLRYGLPGSAEAAPEVLYDVGVIVNYSGPWPVVSADGGHVLFDANTPEGWISGVLPADGGEVVERPGAWYRDLVTRWGILHHDYVQLGAAFAAELDGAVTPLTGWHRAYLVDARLTEDGAWVVYGCDAPEPGWYAARTDGMGGGGALVAPPLTESTDWADWWGVRPEGLAGHLVGEVDDALRSWPLDGSGEAVDVLAGDLGAWTVHQPSGRVVAVRGSAVVSAPADGSEDEVVVLEAAGPVQGVVAMPDSARVIAVAEAPEGLTLLAAAADGCEAEAPWVLATDLPGWWLSTLPAPGGAHVVTVHSVMPTAVPHPDLTLTSALAPEGPHGAPLVPGGYVPWSLALATADGVHAFAVGPEGLYSARLDGSEAEAPVHLAATSESAGPPLAPDGYSVLLVEADRLVVARAGEADSARALTEPLEAGIAQARWTPAGDAVVFHAGSGTSWDDTGLLFRVAAGARDAAPTPLGEGAEVGTLLGLTPDGAWAVVSSEAGGDESLALVPTQPGPVQPLTPVDDAAEALVGVVGE